MAFYLEIMHTDGMKLMQADVQHITLIKNMEEEVKITTVINLKTFLI